MSTFIDINDFLEKKHSAIKELINAAGLEKLLKCGKFRSAVSLFLPSAATIPSLEKMLISDNPANVSRVLNIIKAHIFFTIIPDIASITMPIVNALGQIITPDGKNAQELIFTNGIKIKKINIKFVRDNEVLPYNVFQIVSGSLIDNNPQAPQGAINGSFEHRKLRKLGGNETDRKTLLMNFLAAPQMRQEMVRKLISAVFKTYASSQHERLKLILSLYCSDHICCFGTILLLNCKSGDPLLSDAAVGAFKDADGSATIDEKIKSFYESERNEAKRGQGNNCFIDPQKNLADINKSRMQLEEESSVTEIRKFVIKEYDKRINSSKYWPDTEYLKKYPSMLLFTHWIMFCCCMCNLDDKQKIEKLLLLSGSETIPSEYFSNSIKNVAPFGDRMDEFFAKEKKNLILTFGSSEYYIRGGAVSRVEAANMAKSGGGVVKEIQGGFDSKSIKTIDEHIFFSTGSW